MSEFNQFMNDDLNKYKVGDVLYKVGIYCAYGNYDNAILLLREAYKEHPDAEDYALRLLKLYVLQDNQAEFIGFLFELIKQGKKEIPEFWMQVSDITVEFYPEALFFVTSPEKSNLSADSTSMDSIIDVSETSFDQNISFMNTGSENKLDELNTDLFEFSVQESVKDDSESELIFVDALSFDPIQEDQLEPSFNLDFTALDVEKEMVIDVPNFEFDINFTTPEIEKEAVV
ncbi:MAG: tetratricopeptide repeat protein, partial [Methylococcaceae bacterium]|nr:tetratricopeptide repeat protein [Methylococcaceae bacterium]